MPKSKPSIKSLAPVRSWRKIMLICSVVAIAVVGSLLLRGSRAATDFIAAEVESGAIAAPASRVSDTTASGGAAVKFTAATTGKPTFTFSKAAVWQDDNIKRGIGASTITMDNANAVAGLTKDAQDMQAAGVTWIRMWVTPNTTIATVQKMVSIYQTYGIRPIFDINHGKTSDAATEATLTSYLNQLVPAMAAMGEHYYEVGNEPNLNYSAGWNTCPGITPSATTGQGDIPVAVSTYITRLKNVSNTVRAKDAQSYIITAGLSHNDNYKAYCSITSPAWIAEFVKPQYDVARYFDCFAIHPYSGSPAGVVSLTNQTRNQLYAGGASFQGKPLCLTEVGMWANGYTPGSQNGYIHSTDENLRASYYPQMMDQLKASGINTPVFWYTWYDYSQPSGYGIVHYDNFTGRTYLPIYYTMQSYKP